MSSTSATHVIVEADGGSRGNPGPAGYGAVVKDAATGEVLAERQAGLGIATNNVAEYSGLLAGLQAAADVGASTVDIRMDSKLVVEQMSGRWKVKNATLQPLALKARKLASVFTRVRYEWIPRARNAHADRLANQAMDEQATQSPVTQEDSAEADFGVQGELSLSPCVSSGQAKPASSTHWVAARGTPTTMFVVRHGQTPLSVDRRYSGRSDAELTDYGARQVKALATRLAETFDLASAEKSVPVISSPLPRTVQTAQILADALNTEVKTHAGLIEADFGEWEGLTFAEAAARDPQVHQTWLADPSVPAPGGESYLDVFHRVQVATEELIADYAGQSIVLVSHVVPIKSLLRIALAATPSLFFRMHLDLAALSIVDFYPDRHAVVRLVNDTAQLSSFAQDF